MGKVPAESGSYERRLMRLKYRVARQLGLWEKVQKEGWGGLSAAETGRIGGHMTRILKTGKPSSQESAQTSAKS